MQYIILGGAMLFIAGVLIAYFLHKKSHKKKERAELIKDIKEKYPELLVEKSATQIVETFMWYVKSDKSPYNRQERRQILRHFRKFLWEWWEIPERIRNEHYICEYLAERKWNNHVVHRYVDHYGDTIKGRDEARKAAKAKNKRGGKR